MKGNATAAVMEANNIIKEQSSTAANLVTGEHATVIGQYYGLSECFVNSLLSVKDQQINGLLDLLGAKTANNQTNTSNNNCTINESAVLLKFISLIETKERQINGLLDLLAAKDRQINALTKQLNKAPQRLSK